MQDRVFTVLISVASAVAPLGLAVAGPFAEALGVRAWYIAGGLLCIAMSVLIVRTPALLQLEHGYQP